MNKAKSISLSLALLLALMVGTWLTPATAQAASPARPVAQDEGLLEEWSYVCTDLDQRINVEIIGTGIGNEEEYFGPATLNASDGVDNPEFVEFVVAQVIVRKGDKTTPGPLPGQAVTFTPNTGAAQTVSTPSEVIRDKNNAEQAYVYRARFDGATSVTAEVIGGIQIGNYHTPRSFALFIYSSNPQFISVGRGFYDFVFRNSATEMLTIPTAAQPRDIRVNFDVTDLKEDERFITITATVGSPPNQISASQDLSSSNQGDQLAFAELLLENVPGDATQIVIDVNSPPRRPLPGGASAILGTANVNVECLVGALGNFVFTDSNGNGVQDADELGIPGVTVNLLDGNGDPVIDPTTGLPKTTQTDANGEYNFIIDDTSQPYIVEFIAPEGLTFTTPNAVGDDEVDSDAGANGRTAPVTLAEGEVNLSVDAGLVSLPQSATLGNFVFEDSNSNGLQDADEPGVPGVIVNLLDGNGNPVLDDNNQPIFAVTGDNGEYSFTITDTSQPYIVEFVAPTGRTFTTQNAGGDDATDSDAAPNGRTAPITLAPGETNDSVDAGLLPLPAQTALLGDFVFEDTDGNGVQGADEPGVPGVIVNLLDGNGDPVLDDNGQPIFAITDENGEYSFTITDTSQPYIVEFVAPNGRTFTTQDAGGDAADSDAAPNGRTAPITLEPGETNNTIDAGLLPVQPALGSIGDTVFCDSNGNGVADPGEGIAGVVVELAPADGNLPVAQIETDANGNYLFSGLPAGSYTISVVGPLPEDCDAPTVDPDGPGTPPDGTTTVVLTPGEDNPNIDFGYQPPTPATIGDFIFEDSNENGVQDGDEPGVPGVTVNLWVDENGDGTPDTQISTTTTDNNGNYSFPNLDPTLTYIVQVIPPESRSFTPANAGDDDATDSDIIPALGYSAPITLAPGETNNDIDGGLLPPTQALAALGDFVFEDSNSNGVQDAGEPGVSGVTVNLLVDGVQIASTTTDANGAYSFAGLNPSLTYIVQVAAPAGRSFTTQNAGDDEALDSNVDVNGVTGSITLAAGENNITIDAGLLPLAQLSAALGDFVFLDANENGVQDADEPGITGVTVNLLVDNNGDGAPDEQIATAITDADGKYSFPNLDPTLTYIVQFVAGEGNRFTTPNAGSDDALDSDANVDSGLTAPITLAAGEINNTIDAGIITSAPLASQGGIVWLDQNGNGLREPDEPVVPGVTVNLWVDDDGDGSPDRLISTTTTGDDGRYLFDNLNPALTYIVEFVPGDATFTTPNTGDDTLDSDANSQGLTSPINLEPGEDRQNVDAGLRSPTALDETDEPTQFGNFLFLPLVDSQ